MAAVTAAMVAANTVGCKQFQENNGGKNAIELFANGRFRGDPEGYRCAGTARPDWKRSRARKSSSAGGACNTARFRGKTAPTPFASSRKAKTGASASFTAVER